MIRWLTGLCLVLLLSSTLTLAATTGIQHLPSQYTAKTAVLLDFYAKWCGYCQRMAPVVKRIHQQAGSERLTVVSIDVDDPANRALVRQYHIDSVPTYYLYGPNRQLTFVMDGLLSEPLLKQGVWQATNQLPILPTLNDVTVFNSKPLHWLVIQPGKSQKKFMQHVSQQLADTVQVHTIPLTPTTIAWLKAAQLNPVGGVGLLVDKQRRLLYKARPTTSESTLKLMIGGFSAGQPG
jgi:thioredoxin 1